MISQTDLAYIAGIIDGEGSIGTHRNRARTRPMISMNHTNLSLVEWLAELTGAKIGRRNAPCIRPCLDEHVHRNFISYYWRVQGYRAVVVTHALLPYLRIKQGKAEQLLEEWTDQIIVMGKVKRDMAQRGWPV